MSIHGGARQTAAGTFCSVSAREVIFVDKLGKDIRYLKGVGERRAAMLRKLGIETVGDLLRHYPRSYIDYTSPLPLLSAPHDTPVAVEVRIAHKAAPQRVRGNMVIYKVTATDDHTDLLITLFNNRFLYEALKVGETCILYGKLGGSVLRREMSSPLILDSRGEGRIAPVYSLTAGISSKVLGGFVRSALAEARPLPDPLPEEIRLRRGLVPYGDAVQRIHFPRALPEATEARRRLIFDELLALQLGLRHLAARNRRDDAPALREFSLQPFLRALPFSLTGAQHRAIGEAAADMQMATPMARLLQGDVGSGKTAVAAALCFFCKQNGAQAAFMAPTDILATQHYERVGRMLQPLGVRTALLKGSMTAKQKAEVCRGAAAGEIDLLIGTHAMLSDALTFRSLALVITDEQHRFGVRHRAALTEKGQSPHCLVMSATPIPRTLALIVYGDLDISVLDESPAGRKPVKTYLTGSAKRMDMFGFIAKQLDEGRQAYIVCPLIEGGEDDDRQSVAAYREILAQSALRRYPTGVLHGRMRPREKDAAMAAFAAGETKVLLSTTVVEVGVDVPNASVMVIESAERFGLSQLHQLRGRVGRGSSASYCILLSDSEGEATRLRLQRAVSTSDGFALAEYDLKTRGPGDFFGSAQHGLPRLHIADMIEDMDLLHEARDEAAVLLERDFELEDPQHQGLRRMVDQLFRAAEGSFN